MANPQTLLSFIVGAETSKGYDDYYSGSVLTPPKPVTQMTVGEIKDWQRRSVAAGSESSAVGGIQMIASTLERTQQALGVSDDAIFDQALQNRFGEHLLEGRGFSRWAAGGMSDEEFADGLAKEWAALPMFTGANRGLSAYANDGLNGHTRGIEDVTSALAATRGGEFVDLSGIKGNPGIPYAEHRPVDGGELLDDPKLEKFDTPVPSFVSTRDEFYAAKAREAQEKDGLGAAALGAIRQEWLATAAFDAAGATGFEPDQEWMNTPLTTDDRTRFLDDVPEPYWSYIEDAVSPAHAQALHDRVMRDVETDARLNEYGWGGVALRVGAAIADPVAIGVSALTEGLAAPLIYSAKIGRVTRALRAGAAAGTVNAALEGGLAVSDPRSSWDDVLLRSATGFALGGVMGGSFALRRTPEDRFIDSQLRSLGVDIERGVLTPVPTPSDGSIGAAFVGGPRSEGELLAQQAGEVPKGAFGRIRYDLGGALTTSKSPLVRKLGAALVEDAVHNGSVARYSASEATTRELRVRLSRTYRAFDSNYTAWRKDKGFSGFSAENRRAFNEAVAKAVRRPEDASNPHVRAQAEVYRKEFASLLQFAKDKGLKGFDEVQENALYLTRQHNLKRLDEMLETYGEQPVVNMVAESIESFGRVRAARTGQTFGLERGDLVSIAKGYLRSIRGRRFGGFEANAGLAGDQKEVLEQMLDDAGLASDEIDRIVAKVGRTDTSAEAGRVPFAKFRLGLDETHRMKFHMGDGIEREIGIEDFLDNDVENLFHGYARTIVGRAHLNEALMDFRVPDAEGNLPDVAPSWAVARRRIIEGGNVSESDLARLDLAAAYLEGRPITQQHVGDSVLRVVRDYNFIRVMGQVGVAQLAEIGNLVGNGGLRATLQAMPALRKVFANARTGKFSDEFFAEQEAIWGFGTDYARSTPAVPKDDYGSAEMLGLNNPKARQGNFSLQQAKQAVSVVSGMAHINMALQRMTGKVLVQKLLNAAHGARINKSRLHALGISDEMAERVFEQMRRHVKSTEGVLGRKVKALNIDAWDDMEARAVFVNGVDRWAKRVIQENDIGNMPRGVMTSELGKTIAQFRTFMLSAYAKQLLNGVAHRDWATASSFLMSMVFGGLFYTAQTGVNSIGREDREEYLEDRLSTASIAKAAFQRAGWSSLIPMAADNTVGMLMDEPIFAYRTTELGSHAFFGNPSADLLNTSMRAAQGAARAAIDDNYTYSKRDFDAAWRTMFLNNAFVVRNIGQMIGSQLPEGSY